jgi:3-methylcrotonyl-CoA carboxylase beta subunit
MSALLESRIKRNSPDFEQNTRRIVDLLTEIKNEEARLQEGGGAKAAEAQHKKGRLTARERIARLIDPGTEFFELGIYAAYEMYQEWGGAPAAGTITGLARVAGRLVMVIANDATVKAGAFFPMTAKKVIRAQTSLSKTISRRSTWSIPPVFFCLYRRTFSPTPTILGASSVITR